MSPPSEVWWKGCNIYQIYPSSFLDTNGDDIGDLNGICSKLDYLKDLGIDVVWLCPIYRSPQADMGYDMCIIMIAFLLIEPDAYYESSDYYDIDPMYGTLEDWDSLLRGIHDRGMRLMRVAFRLLHHASD